MGKQMRRGPILAKGSAFIGGNAPKRAARRVFSKQPLVDSGEGVLKRPAPGNNLQAQSQLSRMVESAVAKYGISEMAVGPMAELTEAAIEKNDLRALFCIVFGLKVERGNSWASVPELEKVRLGAIQACADRMEQFVQSKQWNTSCKVGWGYDREFNLLSEIIRSPVKIADKDFQAIMQALDVRGEYDVLLSLPTREVIRCQPKYTLAWIEAQYAAKNVDNVKAFCKYCGILYCNGSIDPQTLKLYKIALKRRDALGVPRTSVRLTIGGYLPSPSMRL